MSQNILIMKREEQYDKESPIAATDGANTVEQKYFTAEESIAYLEPRIRALFK